jgi:putative membrane protein
MSETVKERSLMKGLIAGLIGGLVGTAAKVLAERLFPPHTHGEREAHEVLVERVTGRTLSRENRVTAATGVRWGFGAAAGAAYGALAEYFPMATAKEGASFGLALEALTHEEALPALGLAADPDEMTPRERTSEITSHVVYGVATEMTRGVVRRWL